MTSLRVYIRQILFHFPRCLFLGLKHEGWRGAYVVACAFVLRAVPFPVRVGRIGRVDRKAEVFNVVDNLYLEEIRDEPFEAALAAAPAPWVVDIGVNVGMTVRWWLSWNPRARVTGIDMLEEAFAFTNARLEALGWRDRFQGICAAVGEGEETREVRIDDPLEGTSSLLSREGRHRRPVAMSTLDKLLEKQGDAPVFLLKLDIEGYAGPALEGAARTLSRCRYVLIETHGPEETRHAARLLHRAGLELGRIQGRHMWWVRGPDRGQGGPS